MVLNRTVPTDNVVMGIAIDTSLVLVKLDIEQIKTKVSKYILVHPNGDKNRVKVWLFL